MYCRFTALCRLATRPVVHSNATFCYISINATFNISMGQLNDAWPPLLARQTALVDAEPRPAHPKWNQRVTHRFFFQTWRSIRWRRPSLSPCAWCVSSMAPSTAKPPLCCRLSAVFVIYGLPVADPGDRNKGRSFSHLEHSSARVPMQRVATLNQQESWQRRELFS